MDGKDRVDALIEGQSRILPLEQHRDQTGLPIVAMQDVGLIVDQRQRLEHRAVEEGEALALVPAPAVDRGAVVIELIIDKIEGHAVELEHLDAAILPSPAEIDVEIGQVFHLFTPLRRDIPVKRQDHADLSAQFFQLLGQRTGHIRQPAGLDKRNTFRGCKKDLQRISRLSQV